MLVVRLIQQVRTGTDEGTSGFLLPWSRSCTNDFLSRYAGCHRLLVNIAFRGLSQVNWSRTNLRPIPVPHTSSADVGQG